MIQRTSFLFRNLLSVTQNRNVSLKYFSNAAAMASHEESSSHNTKQKFTTTTIDTTEEVDDSSINVKELSCDMFGRYYATGRRKTSVARVWIKDGCGEVIINDRPFTQYFQSYQRQEILQPFLESKMAGLFDVWCTVKGGGISGQAGAVRLGVSRALQLCNPALRSPLKKGVYMCVNYYLYYISMTTCQ